MIYIFFDVDGVLIDGFHTKPERRNLWDITIEQDLGINPDKFQEIFTGFFQDVLKGRLDFETALDDWLKNNGYTIQALAVIDYWHDKDSNINHSLYRIIEKLSQHDDLALYVATNQTHERAKYLWDIIGFKNHFKDIYYSARLGCLKYDENYFRQIEEGLGINPHQDMVIYFDDDPRNIEVSSKRGWQAVLFDTVNDVSNHPEIKKRLTV